MKFNLTCVNRLSQSLLLGVLLGSFGPAYGQSTTSTESPQVLERLVVTGSYLPAPAAVGASPVVTIDRTAIQDSGATDALRLLKQLSPAFSGSGNIGNEIDFQGAGESFAALRNLPTLVLVNGRRLANSPFSSITSAGALPGVDLNTIPLGMIERIEILKDSASTVYGSDAVGGVINVILRRNYSGLEVGGRYGTDKGGDYTTKEGWAVGGVSRPGISITLGAQYTKTSELLSTDRKISMLEPAELVALGQNPAVLAAHVSSTYAGRNGNFIIAGSPLAVGAPGYNASFRSLPPKTSPTAPSQTLDQLVAAGYYIPINTTPLSRAVGGTTTILNTALYGFAVVLPTERRQAFVSYEQDLIPKHVTLFADFVGARTINGGSNLAPAPIAAVSPLTIPANNPYNLFGIPIGAGGPPNAPGVRTRLDEIGERFSDNVVETSRLTLGLRGEITDAWRWETAFSYAGAEGSQTYFGGANGLVMLQVLRPLLNASGGYVYDPQGRPLSQYVHNGRNVPVFDYFGVPGVNAPETIDALRTTLFRDASIDQRSVDFRVTGKLFELPAGPLAVAFGAEAREEELSTDADALFNAGLALGYLPANDLAAATRKTRAGFLELGVPIFGAKQQTSLAHRLDVTAAIRHERISPGGNANTPKFGLRWEPLRDQLVVRATYGKGFVAPSIFALYGPAQGAVPTVTLPEGNGQTGSGGATGRTVSGQFVAQVAELSNPALTAAKSESRTVGLVYSPKPFRGLNFSADYYRIEQDKVGGFDYAFILGDLNARGSASPFAPGFRFIDGTTLTSTAPNQITSTNAGTLQSVFNPAGDLMTEGLDLAVNYAFSTEGAGAFRVGADVNLLFRFKARSSPASRYLEYAGQFTETLNGKGNPQGVLPDYALRFHAAHTLGKLRSTVRVSHLPEVNAPGTAFGEPAGTPNILRANLQAYTIPSYTTVDLAFTYTLPDFGRTWARRFSVTIGANNVLDEEAPFVPGGGSGVGSESNTVKSTYDIIGRVFFVELRKEF